MNGMIWAVFAVMGVISLGPLSGCTKPQPTKKASQSSAEAAPSEPVEMEKKAKTPPQGGTLIFEDDFSGASLAPHWSGNSGAWTLRAGELWVRGDRNQGLWWTGDVPERTRIEFDATAKSDVGDIKVEVFGKERSHQSGYVVIVGGWNNEISVIARLDEHGKDRVENRKSRAIKEKTHHFVLYRNGETLECWVDGERVMEFDDMNPLKGTSFGFANWEAPVAFDNIQIYSL